MASEAQQNKGYILPTPITGWDLICVRLEIPDAPEYRAAFRGQLKGLTEWWNWEKGDTKGSEAATYWRQIIHEHLVIQDCDELELFGGDMAQFRMCWFYNDDGQKVLRYTLNDGCTWQDVLNCDGSYEPTDPTTPVDPIDDDNGITDPVLTEDVRCRVSTNAFPLIIGTDTAFRDLASFINNVILGLEESLSGNVLIWLQGRGGSMGLSYIEYYSAFKALAMKHFPNQVAIENQYDGSLWSELSCDIYDCLPDNGAIDRDVLNCISDAARSRQNVAPPDSVSYYNFIADYIKIYPLAWAKHRALAGSAITDAVDCSGCEDEPPVTDCDNQYLSFDEAEPIYTLSVGEIDYGGYNAKCLKSVPVAPGTFSGDATWLCEAGSKIVVTLPAVCFIKGIWFREQQKVYTPEPNANDKTGVHMMVTAKSGGVITKFYHYSAQPYYFNLATTWTRYGQDADTPFYADEITLTFWNASRLYANRKFYIHVDDIEIIMATS